MQWWRIDSEKRAFCSNYMYTFRSFPCIKNDIKIDKITIVVHEHYYFTCNLYSNLFSLKYITQWLKKYRKYVVFSSFCRVPCLTQCLRGNHFHVRIIKLQLQFMSFITLPVYSNLFSLKYSTQWLKNTENTQFSALFSEFRV